MQTCYSSVVASLEIKTFLDTLISRTDFIPSDVSRQRSADPLNLGEPSSLRDRKSHFQRRRYSLSSVFRRVYGKSTKLVLLSSMAKAFVTDCLFRKSSNGKACRLSRVLMFHEASDKWTTEGSGSCTRRG